MSREKKLFKLLENFFFSPMENCWDNSKALECQTIWIKSFNSADTDSDADIDWKIIDGNWRSLKTEVKGEGKFEIWVDCAVKLMVLKLMKVLVSLWCFW
jgi:hypothetical protein